MARKLRTVAPGQLTMIIAAGLLMRAVVHKLRSGGVSPRTLGKAKALEKVIDGARRHAERAQRAGTVQP